MCGAGVLAVPPTSACVPGNDVDPLLHSGGVSSDRPCIRGSWPQIAACGVRGGGEEPSFPQSGEQP